MPGAVQACRAVQETRSRNWRHECRLLDADGSPRPVQALTAWIAGGGTADGRLVMVVEDISARKRVEEVLRHRVGHDVLTGLPNRQLLDDRLGHAAGDVALVAFATRLTQVLRVSDTAARPGGGEFVVLCEDTHPAEAHALVARVRRALEEPLAPAGVVVAMAFPVGVARVPAGIRTPRAAVLAEADRRMYLDERR